MDNTYINTDFLSNKVLSQTASGKMGAKERTQGSKSATGDADEKLKKACQDFEAIFLNFMFQSMKKTLPGDSLFGDSLGKDMYESMYHQELSSQIARGGQGIGVGEKLYMELKGKVIDTPAKK